MMGVSVILNDQTECTTEVVLNCTELKLTHAGPN
jgi:hypothetical protein